MNLKFLIKQFLFFAAFLVFRGKDSIHKKSTQRLKRTESSSDTSSPALPRVSSTFSSASSDEYAASRPGVKTTFTIAEEKRVRAEILRQAKIEKKRLRRENVKKISESADEVFDDLHPYEHLDISEFLEKPESAHKKIIAAHTDHHEQIAATDISVKQRDALLSTIKSHHDTLIELHKKQVQDALDRRARIAGFIHDGTHRALIRSGLFSHIDAAEEMGKLKLTKIHHDIRAEEARAARFEGIESGPRTESSRPVSRSAGPRRLPALGIVRPQ